MRGAVNDLTMASTVTTMEATAMTTEMEATATAMTTEMEATAEKGGGKSYYQNCFLLSMIINRLYSSPRMM